MELLKLGLRYTCLSDKVASIINVLYDHVTVLDLNGKKVVSFAKTMLPKLIKVSTVSMFKRILNIYVTNNIVFLGVFCENTLWPWYRNVLQLWNDTICVPEFSYL